MSLFNEMNREGRRVGSETMSWNCNQGVIKLQYALDKPNSGWKAGVTPGISLIEELDEAGRRIRRNIEFELTALPLVTTKIQIKVTPNDKRYKKVSITLPAAEAVELLGGSYPSSETFDMILRRIYERKHYPMPESEVPGGGERSFGAQGQTKKPGSHSHDKHK